MDYLTSVKYFIRTKHIKINVNRREAMPLVRRLVAGFKSRSGHVGFMVDEVARW
jgi:hypothetical protein